MYIRMCRFALRIRMCVQKNSNNIVIMSKQDRIINLYIFCKYLENIMLKCIFCMHILEDFYGNLFYDYY